MDKETGIRFDYWREANKIMKEFGDTWSQVCDKCATKYNLPEHGLDRGCGQGACGVEGCARDADHLYDFNRIELPETITAKPEIKFNERELAILSNCLNFILNNEGVLNWLLDEADENIKLELEDLKNKIDGM